MTIKLVKDIAKMEQMVTESKRAGRAICLVPTMGYLHQGHLALMEEAKKTNGIVVVSIFVNPMQFGVGEDYQEYPRDLTRDMELAQQAGVDYVFAPLAHEMYPQGYLTYVNTEEITTIMCGASRAGHFQGVTTVVAKLFNIIQPDRAYFGEKDAQQLRVIAKMVTDLNIPVKIVPVPIVREADGLAMSSRNVNLSEEERQQAVVLYRALTKAKTLIAQGVSDYQVVYAEIEQELFSAPLAVIEYIQLRHGATLEEQKTELEGQVLIALAVKFGSTRLIDNILVEV